MTDCRCGRPASESVYRPARPVTEYGILMSGGSVQVRPNDGWIEEEYPLAKWIAAHSRNGGKVLTRTVIVVEDWHEVQT